jgi:hypothetical protein
MRCVIAVLLAALTACSTAAPEVRPSPGPSSPPAIPSAEGEDGEVQEFVGAEAPLEPERTTYSEFEPPFTFVVPEGWTGGHEHPDYFDIWNGEDIVIGFALPSAIPTSDGEVAWDRLTARRALRLIAGLGTGACSPAESEVDGRPALEMTFEVDGRTHLLTFGAGDFNVEAPWRQRAIAFEIDDTLLLILVQRRAPGDEADVASVLSSIDFDG